METCVHCGQAGQLVKNGRTENGKQRHRCRACGRNSRPAPGSSAYGEARKDEILRAYQERTSLRGLTRVFGVSRQTVTAWLKKSPGLAPLETTLAAPEKADELESDELWTFVGQRRNKRWLWLALCRRTRQVVAYALGQRDTATARVLLGRLPPGYRTCPCHTDAWPAYAEAIAQGNRPRQSPNGNTVPGPTPGQPTTSSASTPRCAPAWAGSCAKR